MRKARIPVFLLGAGAGVVFAVLAALLAAPVWSWWISRPPSVSSGTTLVLKVSGDLPERPPADLSLLGESPGWSMFSLWDCLRKAAVDPRVAALIVEPVGVTAGWAKLAELRAALENFAKTGKPVVAYVRTPATRDYFLASAAPRIIAAPGDYLNVKGLRVELLYARGALDKLGIVPEFESVGRYKDGPDVLTRSTMSPPTAEAMNSLLDQRFSTLRGAIARARRKTPEQVQALVDGGPYLAAEAQRNGLIDAVQFASAMEAALGKTLGQKEISKLDASLYQRIPARRLGLEGDTRIAVLVASGEIARGASYDLSEVLRPADFLAVVKQLREDRGIKGVVLRIDSPGGDAVASGEMLQAVRELAAVKPVVASISDLAASGGYELAIGAPWIVAYPESLTGSIGIFFGKLNLAGLYQKLGLRYEVLTRGRNAEMDSAATGLDEAERVRLQQMLATMYRDFVADVARARRRSYEQIDRVAQGRVWTGTEAVPAGLVDELGGLDTAISAVARKAGVSATARLRLELYPQAPSLVAYWREQWERVPFVRSMPATVMRRAPVAIEIR